MRGQIEERPGPKSLTPAAAYNVHQNIDPPERCHSLGDHGVDHDPEGVNEGHGMAELRTRLESLVKKAESMGAVVAADAAKCEDLCDLATSICAVQAKMKELCDAHPDDDDYAALCREAKNECREAQDSCVRCVESNQAR